MSIPTGNRRDFLATGRSLLAASCAPDRSHAFQPGGADDAGRAVAAEAGFTFTSISAVI